MIIVSQDRKESINYDNVRKLRCIDNEKQKEIIKNTGLDIFSSLVKQKAGIDIEDIKGYGVYAYFDANDNTMLGQYKTEERAKSVLQEIYKVYSDFELIKYTTEENQNMLMFGNKNKYFDIYEMPLE